MSKPSLKTLRGRADVIAQTNPVLADVYRRASMNASYLAAVAGTTRQTMSTWLSAGAVPSAAAANAIGDHYGLTAEQVGILMWPRGRRCATCSKWQRRSQERGLCEDREHSDYMLPVTSHDFVCMKWKERG